MKKFSEAMCSYASFMEQVAISRKSEMKSGKKKRNLSSELKDLKDCHIQVKGALETCKECVGLTKQLQEIESKLRELVEQNKQLPEPAPDRLDNAIPKALTHLILNIELPDFIKDRTDAVKALRIGAKNFMQDAARKSKPSADERVARCFRAQSFKQDLADFRNRFEAFNNICITLREHDSFRGGVDLTPEILSRAEVLRNKSGRPLESTCKSVSEELQETGKSYRETMKFYKDYSCQDWK